MHWHLGGRGWVQGYSYQVNNPNPKAPVLLQALILGRLPAWCTNKSVAKATRIASIGAHLVDTLKIHMYIFIDNTPTSS